MRSVYRYESASMVFGDLAVFTASLWLSLTLRYLSIPSGEVFLQHIEAFVPLFAIWVGLFVIGGLYDRHLRFSKSKLAGKLWMAQAMNVIIAFLYFYVLQTSNFGTGLAPKTILVVYLAVSTAVITAWRVYVYPVLTQRRPLKVLAVGSVADLSRFMHAKEKLKQSGIEFTSVHSVEEFEKLMEQGGGFDIVVSNGFDDQFRNVSHKVFDLMFSGITYIDLVDFYEEVFEMIPLESIDETWFLKYVSVSKRFIYDALKRTMDIVTAFPLMILSLVWYPIVYIAIKLEDKGPIFLVQERIGEGGKVVKILKFRSMKVSDEGKWVTKGDDRITKVGSIIRKSRIDELPQLWNVLKGDLSLIGPRPELPNLVNLYEEQIPYYNVRHVIKPGLSGWAQIHHEIPPHSVEETRVKLSYDLYYVKNRDLMLDMKIAFATIKTLLSRTGI